MFMNWVPGSAPAAGQVANRLMLSPENGQPLHSMGHVPQQLDVSLYGTPVATARGNVGQYPQVQGIPQAQKPAVQSSGYGNSFLRDQFTVSAAQVSMPQGAFISSQGFPGKNTFREVPNQGLNSGMLSRNVHEGNSPQTNASMKEFSGRQELNSWPMMQQKSTQHGPQGLVALDPMEEKILFNMDDNSWDVSFGRRPDIGAVGFGNMLENTDLGNSLPSIQSGSWSALMQSAMAEASSSDTSLQEEWSGLTLQKTEQSTANQLPNFIKSDNQQTGWVDNNLQSASSSMSSRFPGFQQAGIQFPVEQTEGLRQDGSHESIEKRLKVTGEWIDCNPPQKPSIEGSRQVQSFMHSNNAWAGQIFERSESEVRKLRTASHREDSQTKFSSVPYSVVAHQATSQVRESNQSEYMGHTDISMDNREKETMGKSSQQIGNGSHVYNDSYGGEGETYEKQNYYQSENSNGGYNSKRFIGSEQGYSGQFQFFSHTSSNSINLEQGCLPHFRGNSRASEEVPSKGDLTSVGSDSSNVVARASQNMLELLHKVDQSRDDASVLPLGSAACHTLTKLPESETGKSGVQLYNQSSTSQGFGLRLGPPSQRLPNSSHFLSSQGLPQTVTYPNSRQVNPELRDKNQSWVASPSLVQTLPLPHELSQKAHWDDKSNTSVQAGTSAYSNMQGNSGTTFMHGASYVKSQPHVQFRSGSPVASQSSQATLPSTSNRYPHFLASQDASRQMGTNHLSQQFPVLEAVPVSQPSVMPVMSQQGDMSTRPHNVWTNMPIQRQPSFAEPLKVFSNSPSSIDPSNNTAINTPKGGYGSSEFGPGSQQQISSEILETSLTAGLSHGSKASSKYISDVSALPSGSLVAQPRQQPRQQDFERVTNDDNHAHATTRRNLAAVGHSLDSSPNLHQNYALLDQVRAMKNVETDPSKRSSGVQHDSHLSRDIKTMSFLTEKADDPHARASKGDHTSVGSDSSNVTAQSSQNMLELLHKVDQSRDDASVAPPGSTACNTLAKVPEAETGKAGVQLYNQPSTSQGFGLRLGPPSQRLPNSSHFLSSHGLPQTISYSNSRQINSELREINQTLVASPSTVQTSPLSHELSQRAHWDDKSNASVMYSNTQGNSATAFTQGPTYIKSQPHMQFRSGSPVASQSSQATLPSTGSRYPHFLASQDASRQMGTSQLGQQFPVLEAVPVSQPSVMLGMSQQGDMSARPHNVWTNVPIQRQPSFAEPLKDSSNSPSSIDPSNNNTINAPKGGHGSSEFGSGSQQQISSEILDASQHGSKASSKYISDASALPSSSLVAHPPWHNLDRVKNDDNHAHEARKRNLASVIHSLDSSPNLHQNSSHRYQVRVMKNVETDPSKRSSVVPHDSFPSGDIKVMSSPTEKTDDPHGRALPRPALQDQPSNEMVMALQDQPSNEMVKFGQDNSQSQSGSSNVISDLVEHSQVNRLVVPSRFQPFGSLKNGQMLPMYDPRILKVDTGQFSLAKPLQNLHMHSSVERGDSADASQCGTVMPTGVATLVGTEHISAPYVLPSDITNHSMAIIRPKKRKSVTSELLPWHKEVTQGSQRPQNMSIAEQDWARATNRMIEKVGNEVEITEDVQPMLRSKRRLILTTQLMQQLLSPAPKSILSANATSHHDGVIYFVSRLAVGEACSLTCCTRKDLLVPTENSNMASENHKTIEGTGDQQVLNFIEELSARAQKLENDFERVDETASMVDIRVECQELEKFAVINRFAKFHIGGQADTYGTPKPFPQRYVTAHPMPRKLPEGLQCVSL